MAEHYILHEDPRSGNCHKIKLTAALLGLELETRQYDLLKGETRAPEFLENVNANGRIPVLEIAGDGGSRFLPESNAACWYLATGSALIPDDRFAQADMLRWMFFEQYNHEPNVAVLRFWMRFVGEHNMTADQVAQVPDKKAASDAAIALMARELAQKPFLCGDTATLADIVLYPYTSVAEEGGLSLSQVPRVRDWIARLEALSGFVAMA